MLNLACDLCPSLGYILVEPVVFCVDPPYKSDAAMQYTSFLERRYFINNIYYLITGTLFWFLLFTQNSKQKQPNKNPSPHHASKNSPMFLKDTHTPTHTHTLHFSFRAHVCVANAMLRRVLLLARHCASIQTTPHKYYPNTFRHGTPTRTTQWLGAIRLGHRAQRCPCQHPPIHLVLLCLRKKYVVGHFVVANVVDPCSPMLNKVDR